MTRVMMMICVFSVTLCMHAFAVESAPQQKKPPQGMQVHGSGPTDSKRTLLDVLKSQKLAHYPASTIGKAFDNYAYFSKVEWKEFREPGGKIYFDCTARIKKKLFGYIFNTENVTSRSLEVKFMVTPEGDFGVVMASLIEVTRDGRFEKKPLQDLKGVLDSIYANKEISFKL